MISSENKNWTTPILITTIVTIMLGTLYFSSSYLSKQETPPARKEFDYSGRPTQYMTTPTQVVLKINEKLAIGRNALVFKGVEKNVVIVDLYLLDMDSEQAYKKRFLKKEAKKEMVLGKGRYRLLSVNDKNLILKIIEEPSTL
ncbi:hypothetical protein ACFL0S_07205 [Thermodesulfobacteriota bacterium]